MLASCRTSRKFEVWITESNSAEWEQFCSTLDACEDIPLPKESLKFESVDGNDGMARCS